MLIYLLALGLNMRTAVTRVKKTVFQIKSHLSFVIYDPNVCPVSLLSFYSLLIIILTTQMCLMISVCQG